MVLHRPVELALFITTYRERPPIRQICALQVMQDRESRP